MTITADADLSYCKTHIPDDTWKQLQAGAFQLLIDHLQQRSDEVQNIDLMTISGFCRNCLAKWLVLEARKVAKEMKGTNATNEQNNIINALDAMGYDDAAYEVYGCEYPKWKKRHAKKASVEQMQKYNDSSDIHAKHEKEVLKPVLSKEVVERLAIEENKGPDKACIKQASGSLLSDVCCEDVENLEKKEEVTNNDGMKEDTREKSSGFNIPSSVIGKLNLNVGILTVSDRASNNQYETGDLSGPAVESAFQTALNSLQKTSSLLRGSVVNKMIISDEKSQICDVLTSWSRTVSGSESPTCNLIFTTGGTGFSRRDVTPEATLSIIDCECRGFMPFISNECATFGNQPLAALSRGVCGLRGQTIIMNLPGNPAGAAQIVGLALPLIVHAVKDLES